MLCSGKAIEGELFALRAWECREYFSL